MAFNKQPIVLPMALSAATVSKRVTVQIDMFCSARGFRFNVRYGFLGRRILEPVIYEEAVVHTIVHSQ